MKEENQERMAKALRAGLSAAAPGMPSDLKASLKRLAREREAARRAGPRWVAWREALFGSPWTYGMGAAFAAAALVLAVRTAGRKPEPAPAPVARWTPAETAAGLQGLWNDDDGKDDDEG